MNITRYSVHENLDEAMKKDEPMLAIISFNGQQAYMGHIDECMEHHILLAKVGLSSGDIDKYFLVYNDGRLWCRLVLFENLTEIENKVMTLSLGIGCGCDSSDETQHKFSHLSYNNFDKKIIKTENY